MAWLTAAHPEGAGLSSRAASALLLGVASACHSGDVEGPPAGETTATGAAGGVEDWAEPMPAEVAARRLAEYSFSVGRHAAGVAHVVTEYGAAELPQALCRAAAVGNTTYVLREGALQWRATEEKEAEPEAGVTGLCSHAEAAADAATAVGLPGVRTMVRTSHGDVHCRCLCLSAAYAAPPPWGRIPLAAAATTEPFVSAAAPERVVFVSHAVALLAAPAGGEDESVNPPLPVPSVNGSGLCSRVIVVVPPRTLPLPGGELFEGAVRVLQGGASDSTAPRGGRHFQLHAVAVGEAAVGTRAEAEARAGRLLEGARAAIAWASRGFVVLYQAGWAESKPLLTEQALDACGGVSVADAIVVGRPAGSGATTTAVDASTFMRLDTEAECASAMAVWDKLKGRFPSLELGEMFAKPVAADVLPDIPPEENDADKAPTDYFGADEKAACAEDDFDAADLASLLD